MWADIPRDLEQNGKKLDGGEGLERLFHYVVITLKLTITFSHKNIAALRFWDFLNGGEGTPSPLKVGETPNTFIISRTEPKQKQMLSKTPATFFLI